MIKTISPEVEQQLKLLLTNYKRSDTINLEQNQKRYYDYLGFVYGVKQGYKTNPIYEHKVNAMVGVGSK